MKTSKKSSKKPSKNKKCLNIVDNICRQGTWAKGTGTGGRELDARNWQKATGGRELELEELEEGNWSWGNGSGGRGKGTGGRELGNWGKGTGRRELELGEGNCRQGTGGRRLEEGTFGRELEEGNWRKTTGGKETWKNWGEGIWEYKQYKKIAPAGGKFLIFRNFRLRRANL